MSRVKSHLVADGSKCPRCKSTNFCTLDTFGGFEYRECGSAVCRERFHVQVRRASVVAAGPPASPPKSAANPPEVEDDPRPQCPYCLTNYDMREFTPGRFTCDRRHHPQVIIDAESSVLSIDRPRERFAVSSHSRTRGYDRPIDPNGPVSGDTLVRIARKDSWWSRPD